MPPSVGVNSSVPLPADVVYVMMMTPVVSVMPTLVTAGVAEGAVQPIAYPLPLAAFSDTANLAALAKDKPSVTFARTV